jgi:hypothetical protein
MNLLKVKENLAKFDDAVKTTEEFWKLIESMVGVASCSVSEVMRRLDGENHPHKHVVYKIHLYCGPFCVWKTRRKLKMENPIYVCRRDVIQFIGKALSDRKSPYYFNQKTGKWDHHMMVM